MAVDVLTLPRRPALSDHPVQALQVQPGGDEEDPQYERDGMHQKCEQRHWTKRQKQESEEEGDRVEEE